MPFLLQPAGRLGSADILVWHLAVPVGLAVFALLWRWARGSAVASRRAEGDDAARQLDQMLAAQAELAGRLSALGEVFATRHEQMSQTLHARIDGMAGRIGQSITEQTRATHENLTRLQERLAVIDTAQGNIQALAGHVVELQSILSNKQTRGAFGQGRMEAIIADGLPQGAYTFQATLSNGSRPDCLIHMPNGGPGLVIDAKFPLEAWNAIRGAEGEDVRRVARQRFRRDIEVHLKDISSKYLIAGETQDTAFMFVPSESVFADIHEHFEGLVHRAHKSRVVIVSPSLLMLSVQVVLAILKDARLREQAHLIQGEVGQLMDDLGRLNDRVMKLQAHFAQATGDIDQIVVSTGKLARRGRRIGALDFDEPGEVEPAANPSGQSQGRLHLRLAGED